MKLRFLFAISLVLLVISGIYMYFYSLKPVITFKKELNSEVNVTSNIFDYIDKVDGGKITSTNEQINTGTIGYKNVIVKTKNPLSNTFYYSIQILVKDTVEPEITYNEVVKTTQGEEIDLLKDVKVTDNSNENIIPKVEGSYDFNTPGSYKLQYVAEDSSHNKKAVDFTLEVSKRVVYTPTYRTPAAEGNYPYYIKVNRNNNVVLVYGIENGVYTNLVKVFTVSTGSGTPLGVYRTTDKYVWRQLIGNVWGQYATRITGQILFHSVPYLQHTKNSLEYWEYNLLGVKRSLGCIRLTVEDAKWLYDNCPSGTKVEIYDGDLGGIAKPDVPKIDTNSENRGWDPTDPDPNNPW